MATMQDHYATHLGPIYTWMVGDVDAAIARAAAHDFDGFAEQELADRGELGYPPFARMAMLRVEGPDRGLVQRLAELTRLDREHLMRMPAAPGNAEALVSRSQSAAPPLLAVPVTPLPAPSPRPSLRSLRFLNLRA